MWGREKKTAIIVATRSMSSSFEKKIKRSVELVFIFAEFLCHAHWSDATQSPLQSRLVYPRLATNPNRGSLQSPLQSRLVYPRLATNPNRGSLALSVRHRWSETKARKALGG